MGIVEVLLAPFCRWCVVPYLSCWLFFAMANKAKINVILDDLVTMQPKLSRE